VSRVPTEFAFSSNHTTAGSAMPVLIHYQPALTHASRLMARAMSLPRANGLQLSATANRRARTARATARKGAARSTLLDSTVNGPAPMAGGSASEVRICLHCVNVPKQPVPSLRPQATRSNPPKRDYVYLADLPDAKTTLALLEPCFRDYNETHPHKGLKRLSPQQFRTANST
jgi:hypothetical protein